MEIHVIRHTPIKTGKTICYGRLEVPLAESFQDDLHKYQQKLAADFERVYCSPSLRCKSLAAQLGYEPIHFDDRLLELDFGDWEGKPWNEIDSKKLNTWMEDFVASAPENGESLQEMFNRVSQFIEALRNKEFEKILLVTHAGVIRCLWSYLLEIPLKNVFKLPVKFDELFIFNLAQQAKFDTIIQLK